MNDTQLTQAIAKCEPTALSKVATPEPPHVAAGTVCEENIRDLAHQKWEAAGCPDGDGMEFWLKAENELASPVSRDDEQQTSGGFDDTVGF